MPPARPVRLRGDRVAWLLTVLFGMQAMLFYSALTWIPDILQDAGDTPEKAGAMLSVGTVAGIPAAFIASSAAARTRDQRAVAAVLAGMLIVGLTGVLLVPGSATAVWMAVFGAGAGGLFSLSLALVVLRSPDAAHATALSGMVQGVGYVLAALGPLGVGVLHDVTGSWTVPVAAMAGAAGLTLLVGLGAGRPGTVGHGPAQPVLEPEMPMPPVAAAPPPALNSEPAAASSCMSAGTDARSSS
jgi:CP family cyanate transporter-like MFS transporter